MICVVEFDGSMGGWAVEVEARGRLGGLDGIIKMALAVGGRG